MGMSPIESRSMPVRRELLPYIMFLMRLSSCVITNTIKSRNLSEQGHDMDILTGMGGANSKVVESETLLDQDGLLKD